MDKSLIEVNIKEINIDPNTPYGKPIIDFLIVWKYWKAKQMMNDFIHGKKNES